MFEDYLVISICHSVITKYTFQDRLSFSDLIAYFVLQVIVNILSDVSCAGMGLMGMQPVWQGAMRLLHYLMIFDSPWSNNSDK